MKVRELIGKLEQADPELDVVVALIRAVPSMGTLSDGKITPEDGVERIPDPERQHEIHGVSLIRDMQSEGHPEQVVIAYEPSDVQNAGTVS